MLKITRFALMMYLQITDLFELKMTSMTFDLKAANLLIP